MIDFNQYQGEFSDAGFWSKIKQVFFKLGSKVLFEAIAMYYAAIDSNTPIWAKSIIYGALGYLILPIDLVPDYLPMVGFSDDIVVIGKAFLTVRAHVTDEHKAMAALKIGELLAYFR